MDTESSSLLHKALLGLLIGGGTYGGMRLLADIPKTFQKTEKPKSELELTLPAARMPKLAQDHSAIRDYLLPLLAWGGGGAAGFLGASKLYDIHQQNQLKKREQGVEDEYLRALQQAHQKVAALQTPNIDKFLEGLIEKTGEVLQKEALNFSDPGIPAEGIGEFITNRAANVAHGVANTELGSAAIAAWLLGTLGTAGATYALANRMDQNKQKNKEQTMLPHDIRLNVAH